MSGPQRAKGQTAISISLPESLVAAMDARAEALGLSRSQYLAQLARQDLAERGALVLREVSSAADQAAGKIVGAAVDESAGSTKVKPPATGPVKYKVPRRSKKTPPA